MTGRHVAYDVLVEAIICCGMRTAYLCLGSTVPSSRAHYAVMCYPAWFISKFLFTYLFEESTQHTGVLFVGTYHAYGLTFCYVAVGVFTRTRLFPARVTVVNFGRTADCRLEYTRLYHTYTECELHSILSTCNTCEWASEERARLFHITIGPFVLIVAIWTWFGI